MARVGTETEMPGVRAESVLAAASKIQPAEQSLIAAGYFPGARALEKCPLTGQPLVVHHATAQPTKWESGGGGAVSTAADYLRFVQMLLDGGVLGSTRILGRKTVEMMRADHLGPEISNRIVTMDAACNGYGFGLGFAVRKSAGVPGLLGSAGEVL